MIYDKKNDYNHILFINIFHIGIQKIGKVKWYPFTYNGEITDYEASNTGLIRNKDTKKILEKSKPTLKILKRLAEKANNKLGEHYLRVCISNLKTKKGRKKANLSVHKIVYCACNNIDYKDIPKNQQIDHINRCRFDNRITNLRCVSREENCKNRDTTNMKDKYCILPIYLYKYEDKMNGRKTRKLEFNSENDPEFIKFKKKNKIPKGAFNKGKNLIGGIKKTNQQRCLSKEKFAFYYKNNKFIVEEILEEYIDEDELEIIGEFENAHNAAKFLKEKTEYDTGKSDSNTIRGQIWKSIKKNKVIYGNIICKKGKKYTLKQGEITKDIKIGGKTFQATSFGNILQNGKKCYTPMKVHGYYMFKDVLAHHIIYAAFNDLSIKDLKNKLTPNGKREYVIDHISQKNKTDNSINNLKMKTYAENIQSARDAGKILGQISGTMINETTGEEFSFNHIPQSAEFLQKQKGFTRLKISSLRTWIQKALKDGVKYLSECKFMDGSCEKPVAVYNKTGTILIGIFNSITEALNSDEVKNKMIYKKNINLKNIKLYDTLIPNEIFDTLNKVVSYLQKISKSIKPHRIQEVINETRSHVNNFKITKKNNKYYIYSKKAIKFNKEIVKKEFKTHDTFWKYIKDVYNLEGQKSSILQKIINNNNMFKIQRDFPLFKISYDRIFAKKCPGVVCAGIKKYKGIAYGLKWEYCKKTPMDIIRFENINSTQ